MLPYRPGCRKSVFTSLSKFSKLLQSSENLGLKTKGTPDGFLSQLSSFPIAFKKQIFDKLACTVYVTAQAFFTRRGDYAWNSCLISASFSGQRTNSIAPAAMPWAA